MNRMQQHHPIERFSEEESQVHQYIFSGQMSSDHFYRAMGLTNIPREL